MEEHVGKIVYCGKCGHAVGVIGDRGPRRCWYCEMVARDRHIKRRRDRK